MGTLIIFIAMILVAAVAAKVLISTTGTLQNKALSTGKATSQEVGTSLRAIEAYGEDGTDQDIEYLFMTIKLSSGSDEIRLQDTLLSLNLKDSSLDYQYNTSVRCANTSYYQNVSAAYNMTLLNQSNFGVNYQITGTNNKSGYLTKGDVVQVCIKTPRAINESEGVKLTMMPMVGAPMVIDSSTPDLMVDTRIPIYP